MSERGRVREERRDGIAILTLENPPGNAFTHEMMLALDAAVLRARFDGSVHALVVVGGGERAFSTGTDVAALAAMTSAFRDAFFQHVVETTLRLERTRKLVVAALNGHAIGGGLEIAMACDLRLAWERGQKLALPEVGLGAIPGAGGTQRLPRLVGTAAALELLIEGRSFGLDEAERLGLVHRRIEAPDRDAFLAEVAAHVGRFLPPVRAPGAIAAIKRALALGRELPLADALLLENELEHRALETDDGREGLRAFVEKRPPRFTGR